MLKRIERIFILAAIVANVTFAQDRLYIFYPLIVTRAPVIQELFTELSGQHQIKVFNDPKQFFASVMNEKPDIIITKKRVLSQLNGFTPILQGIRDKEKKESYVLLSICKPLQIADITSSTTVGMIKFSSTEDIKALVEECIHQKVSILPVNKPEDLVFLLVQERIDCTIIPEILSDHFINSYKLDFHKTPLTCNDPDIISCAVRSGSTGILPLRREFTSESGKNIAQLFRIDQWKKTN